ncbi:MULTISPECIES: NifU family protein [Capnocytophaga]|nr:MULTISPECIES: NifU family protein [Capnocytophaga]ATA75915.1 iron-sulfur cluster biogenesis protein NfuA [Capnocytophaga sp. H2931]RIY36517.1 NifU family protein [Capnocytophaga canis]CEN42826.1 NifU-like protein [Capnocytophaga canis]CEN47378.1 NifU-like protein [Capnocytophaga canis]
MSEVTISIQPTSNPEIIKLEASKILVKGSYEFNNIDEAKNSPLAQQLFYLPFIKTVYISSNFIALKRYPIVEWADVQEELAEQISVYINSGNELITTEQPLKKLPITVYAESTPNPTVMKFVVNKQIVPVVLEYKNVTQTQNAPLAKALFDFPFVKEVFFDENYISITKDESVKWFEITMELREFIRTYLADGNKVVLDKETKKEQVTNEKQIEKSPLVTDITSQKIVALLDEYVKPAVASDGGNIQFVSYNKETHQVEVILQGACSGCPSSTMTLKNGIENLLQDQLQNSEIRVIAING